MSGLVRLSDEALEEVYSTAMLLCLEIAFIRLIQLEMERRGMSVVASDNA